MRSGFYSDRFLPRSVTGTRNDVGRPPGGDIIRHEGTPTPAREPGQHHKGVRHPAPFRSGDDTALFSFRMR